MDGPTGRPDAALPLHPFNPGFHDEWTRKVKDVFPIPLDGAKVVLNKMLSSRFQVAHTLNLSEGGPPSQPGMGPPPVAPYLFQATFVGKAEHDELTPVYMAEMDNSGSLNGQVIRHLNQRLRCKAVVQTQKSKWLMSQGAMEFKGDTYSASLTAINPDLMACSGVLASSFIKRITPSLCLGSDFTVHNAQGQMKSSLGVCGKYVGSNWEAIGSLNKSGFQASFFKECSSTSSVGVEWDCSAAQGDSNVTLGYKIDLNQAANFLVRGSIDTTGTITATYEKRFHPFTLALSGSMNHYSGSSKFGFGLTIG